jgi:predicted metal-binding membrane protein
MFMMFGAGVANLPWMAVLTGVMFYEKAGQKGRAVTPYVGVALLVWAAVVLAHPAWLPHAVAGVS